MKMPHISLGALIGALSLWKELHEELPGTGQSVMDLIHSGWSYLGIREYFPIPVLNLTLFVVAISFLVLGGHRKWTGYLRQSTRTRQPGRSAPSGSHPTR